MRWAVGGDGWWGSGLAAEIWGGRRHEHRGPCPRWRVCPEACGHRGGEAGRAQGGGCAPAPGSGIRVPRLGGGPWGWGARRAGWT